MVTTPDNFVFISSKQKYNKCNSWATLNLQEIAHVFSCNSNCFLDCRVCLCDLLYHAPWPDARRKMPMQSEVEEFLFPEPRLLLDRLSASTGPRFAALNVAIGQMLEEFSLVSFVPLDITDEER
jgi:hypothetical protein